MTDPTYTAVCLLVDRSGSMGAIRSDAEGAINSFIADQTADAGDDRRTLRLVVFDHTQEVVHSSTSFAATGKFVLTPRGTTALLDAMGTQITVFGEELAALPEDQRPAHVVFAVMTDGLENASAEYTHAQVAAMVAHQRDTYGWNIVYLGANQDAIAEAAKLGVDRGSALTYSADRDGTRSVGASFNAYVTTTSRGHSASFTDTDRAQADRAPKGTP